MGVKEKDFAKKTLEDFLESSKEEKFSVITDYGISKRGTIVLRKMKINSTFFEIDGTLCFFLKFTQNHFN